MCPRVTGYNKMSRKLQCRVGRINFWVSFKHLPCCKNGHVFRKQSCYFLDKIVLFSAPATSRHLPDVGNSLLRCIWCLAPFPSPFPLDLMSATSYLELQWSSDSLLGLLPFPCHPAHLKSSTWKIVILSFPFQWPCWLCKKYYLQ